MQENNSKITYKKKSAKLAQKGNLKSLSTAMKISAHCLAGIKSKVYQ